MRWFVCCWQNNSVSPSDSLRAASEKHRSSSDYGLDSKKRKVDDKDSMSRYVSMFSCFFICSFGEKMQLSSQAIYCSSYFVYSLILANQSLAGNIFCYFVMQPLHNWLTVILPQCVKPVTPSFQDSDGDKSDDLVVDVSNEVRLLLNRVAQPHSFVWRLHRKQTQVSFVCKSLNTFCSVAKKSVIILVVCCECVLTCCISFAIHAESKTKHTKRKGCDRWM